MTGRRKSCKTCKKVAATGSLPFMDPVVDGVIYQNTDHEENNPTADFRLRTPDAISYPVTPGAAVADPSLGRAEATPGFRKTAKLRKAAIQATSFTAVAEEATQQMNVANHEADNEDADKNSDKNDNCSYGDNKDPKGGAGCSDPRASKAEVAVHVQAGPTGSTRSAHTGLASAPAAGPSSVTPIVAEATNIADVHGGATLVLPLRDARANGGHTTQDPTWREVRKAQTWFEPTEETPYTFSKVDGVSKAEFPNPFKMWGLKDLSFVILQPTFRTDDDTSKFLKTVRHTYNDAKKETTAKEIFKEIIFERKDNGLEPNKKIKRKNVEEILDDKQLVPRDSFAYKPKKDFDTAEDFEKGLFRFFAEIVFFECLHRRRENSDEDGITVGSNFALCIMHDMNNSHKDQPVPGKYTLSRLGEVLEEDKKKFVLSGQRQYHEVDVVKYYIYPEKKNAPQPIESPSES